MRPRSFCDTRSIRSNCFPGAGLIRSHRCKRRRCTDGAAAGRARHAAVLHCGAGSCGSALEAPQRLPAHRRAIRPLGNDHHDLKGIEDGEQGERSPRAGATRHPSPPFSAHQPSGQKRESRAFPPQNGVHPPRRASALLCPPCFPYIFPPQPKYPRPVPGTTRDPTGKIAEGRSGRWGIGQASAARRRAI